MHPNVRERGLSSKRFTLGDLILMVREDQIASATMYVDLFAEGVHCHC